MLGYLFLISVFTLFLIHFMIPKIYSGIATSYLGHEIAKSCGIELGDINIKTFSDGEKYVAYRESIRGSYVFLVQSTFAPSDNLMELLLMIDAAKRASAGYITVVIPYFGYARQDRKDAPRVAIGAKLISRLLEVAGANRIVTMDLHAPQLQGFFDIPLDHLDSTAIFVPYIERLLEQGLVNDPVFVAPDVGSIARIRKVAMYFGGDMALCDKQRTRANVVESSTLIGDVCDRDVIMIDDICDTAGSLEKSSAVIKDSGARSIRAFCTHPVLSGQAYARIEQSILEELVVCDTIPLRQQSNKIRVLSTASLFARAIQNVQENKSIHDLFILPPKKKPL